jgi:hypothetical protein
MHQPTELCALFGPVITVMAEGSSMCQREGLRVVRNDIAKLHLFESEDEAIKKKRQ